MSKIPIMYVPTAYKARWFYMPNLGAVASWDWNEYWEALVVDEQSWSKYAE